MNTEDKQRVEGNPFQLEKPTLTAKKCSGEECSFVSISTKDPKKSDKPVPIIKYDDEEGEPHGSDP